MSLRPTDLRNKHQEGRDTGSSDLTKGFHLEAIYHPSPGSERLSSAPRCVCIRLCFFPRTNKLNKQVSTYSRQTLKRLGAKEALYNMTADESSQGRARQD